VGLQDSLSPGRRICNGVSWQIVPTMLVKLLNDRNPEKSNPVMQAMLQMSKVDIAALIDAYDRK
jgi:hypothetical protein